jgi:PAS domain S-box-containing protein
MSPKFDSPTQSDTDKNIERLLAELGELRSRNAVLEESRANRALKALSECKEAMIRAGDEAVLLNDICRIIVDVGGYRMAWIGYIENDGVKTVRPVARAGYDEGYVDNLNIALEDPIRGSGPTSSSLKTGKPYGSRDVRSDEEMRPWREEALNRGYLSTLNLPIVYEKKVIGALVIYSGKTDAFDEEERGLLFELAQTLAYGITAMRDRAKRIRTEEELIRVNKELEIRIDERTAKLRESEARSRALFESAGAAIFVADVATGKITDCNAMAEELIGRPREEITGLHQTQLHPAEMAAERQESFVHNASEGKTTNYETVVQHQDGRIIPVIINAAKLKINKKEIMLGVFIDISERKRAEEAMRMADVRFRSLIQNSMDIIRILDNEGRIIYESPSSDKILGYPPGHTLGKSPLEFIHPDDRERVRNDLDEVYGGRNPGMPTEFRIRKADGSYLDVESIGKNMIGIPGVDGIVITTRPITERKRAEKALKEAKAQAELYVDLMGHDINNMNQISMGFLELAHNIIEMEGKLGEDNIVLLDKAMNSLVSSSQLIDNVRKLQRERMGLYKLEVLDVDGVIEDAAKQFHSIPGRNVKIIRSTQKHCRVNANGLLKDVFINLIGNAVKHSRGSITINIKVDQVVDAGIKYCRVAVEDDGPGIPDTLKNTLFDRLSLTTTRARGKGFGLSLIKMLVDDYHGKFWVEDRIKGDHTNGARFVVMLPSVEK